MTTGKRANSHHRQLKLAIKNKVKKVIISFYVIAVIAAVTKRLYLNPGSRPLDKA